jgi:hypothetical protein
MFVPDDLNDLARLLMSREVMRYIGVEAGKILTLEETEEHGSPSKALSVSTPASKRPALTAKLSPSFCIKLVTPSASLIRQPSTPSLKVGCHGLKQTR